jgi:prepilin-type N-terminal cleavage/methylation domain-containing protein
MLPARSSSSNGFSLTEVLVAMGILTAVSLGVAQLFAMSARQNFAAKGDTSTTVLAEQKMEQLRALTWGFDDAAQGLPVSDTSTNLSVDPSAPTGQGLNPSPSNSLSENVAGYVDYLDAAGAYAGTGGTPPAGAAYVRRWSIQPLPTNPNNTLVLQVFVTTVGNDANRGQTAGDLRRLPGDALLTSVKTRKAR